MEARIKKLEASIEDHRRAMKGSSDTHSPIIAKLENELAIAKRNFNEEIEIIKSRLTLDKNEFDHLYANHKARKQIQLNINDGKKLYDAIYPLWRDNVLRTDDDRTDAKLVLSDKKSTNEEKWEKINKLYFYGELDLS